MCRWCDGNKKHDGKNHRRVGGTEGKGVVNSLVYWFNSIRDALRHIFQTLSGKLVID